MCAVHLGVVKLERQLQRRPEKSFLIFAPDEEWIVENAAVHADGPVDFGIHNGGCPDNHAFRQIVVFAVFGYGACQPQVIGVELRKAARKRHIAGADLTVPVFHDSIYRYAVILQQLTPDRKQSELPDPACRPADTPAEKHIEFQPAAAG